MGLANRRGAQPDLSGRVPQRELGHVAVGSATYLLIDCDAWNGAVTYMPGNLVSDSGSSYVALPVAGFNVASLPHHLEPTPEPPNGTYWQVFTGSSCRCEPGGTAAAASVRRPLVPTTTPAGEGRRLGERTRPASGDTQRRTKTLDGNEAFARPRER